MPLRKEGNQTLLDDEIILGKSTFTVPPIPLLNSLLGTAQTTEWTQGISTLQTCTDFIICYR